MTTKTKRKVRKPKLMNWLKGCCSIESFEYDDFNPIFAKIEMPTSFLCAKDCRALGVWLIKAADYLEQQERK